MFEIAWGPIVGVASQLLETLPDDAPGAPHTVAQCLRAFRHAIRVGAVVGPATARDTLVNVLAKFTTLDHGGAQVCVRERGDHLANVVQI
jgi:hypothetical protein